MRLMKDMEFEAKLTWDGESGGELKAGRSGGLKVDMPVEFGGKGRYPCPDELFLSGIAGCLLTTFLYFRKKLNATLERLEISITGTLRFQFDGYEIAAIDATMHAKTDKNGEANVRRCIELTKKYCHITRTLEKAIPVRVTDRVDCW